MNLFLGQAFQIFFPNLARSLHLRTFCTTCPCIFREQWSQKDESNFPNHDCTWHIFSLVSFRSIFLSCLSGRDPCDADVERGNGREKWHFQCCFRNAREGARQSGNEQVPNGFVWRLTIKSLSHLDLSFSASALTYFPSRTTWDVRKREFERISKLKYVVQCVVSTFCERKSSVSRFLQ